MKTIITSTGEGENHLFDLRFGRAAWFCIYDEELKSTRFIKNKHLNVDSGAGKKVVQEIIDLGVSKVISGDFGPKTKEMLEKFSIQMVILNDNQSTIKDILEKLNS